MSRGARWSWSAPWGAIGSLRTLTHRRVGYGKTLSSDTTTQYLQLRICWKTKLSLLYWLQSYFCRQSRCCSLLYLYTLLPYPDILHMNKVNLWVMACKIYLLLYIVWCQQLLVWKIQAAFQTWDLFAFSLISALMDTKFSRKTIKPTWYNQTEGSWTESYYNWRQSMLLCKNSCKPRANRSKINMRLLKPVEVNHSPFWWAEVSSRIVYGH